MIDQRHRKYHKRQKKKKPNKGKSSLENTKKLKFTPDIEDHANYVIFSENKALELKNKSTCL